MESIIRDVTNLDELHRRALEDVLGQHLKANQRLIISITEIDATQPEERPGRRKPQTLSDWTRVYEGLSDSEVEAIDKTIKTRADLTRHLP